MEGYRVEEHTDVLFLGTGTSGGVPDLGCVVDERKRCKTCADALIPGSRNRRQNTSIVIKTNYKKVRETLSLEKEEAVKRKRSAIENEILDSGEEQVLKSRNILIDCGKYFWASALKAFPEAGVDHLDAVILTHAHADAFFGIDDLRDFANIRDGGCALPVYVRDSDLPELARTFPYLMNKGQTANNMHVPALSFENYPANAPFTVLGLEFTPLPVHHGHGILCSAFLFGNSVYMSDVNEIPEEVSSIILSRFTPFSTFDKDQDANKTTEGITSTPSQPDTSIELPTNPSTSGDSDFEASKDHSSSLSPTSPPPFASKMLHPSNASPHLELLVLDALWPEKSYNSHFSLKDAIREFSRFRPVKGLCTGMSHEIEYQQYTEYLSTVSSELRLDLGLGYDGLMVPVSLPNSSSFWLSHTSPASPPVPKQ